MRRSNRVKAGAVLCLIVSAVAACDNVQWGGAEESPLKADVVAALMATQDPSAAAVLDVRAPEHPVVRGGEPAGT